MDNKFLVGLVLLLSIPIGVLEYKHQNNNVDQAQVAPVQPQLESQPQQPATPKVEPQPSPQPPQQQPKQRPSCPPGRG
jgi:hypothetical protein